MNDLSIEVYEQYSTTAIIDNAGAFADAVVESYDTFYPGGLYGNARIFVPLDPSVQWLIGNPRPYRFIIRNGQNVVYEGWKISDGRRYGSAPGYIFNLVGAFGKVGLRRDLRRLYADDRISEDVWQYRTDASAAEKCDVDRNERMRFTPKSIRDSAGNEVGWTNGQGVRLRYSAPTGERVKFISWNYDLQESTQQWVLALYDASNTAVWSVSSTGTGGTTHTFGTAQAYVDFIFYAGASQTPATDGTMYGEVSDVMVHAETNNPAGYTANLGNVINDIRIEFSAEINAGTIYHESNTQAIGTFITQGGGFEYIGDIFNRISGLGDSSNNPWAAGFLASTYAGTVDGKPVLYYEQQPDPAGSTFDYQLSFQGENLLGDPEIERNYDNIWNDVRVHYTTPEGFSGYRTSGDNASLTDSESVTRWGTNSIMIDAGEAGTASADNYGIRYLKRHRYSEYKLPASLQVKGYILGASGELIPASEIRAGKLVKLTDFTIDNLPSTGFNTIFLITQTSYSDADETCTIYTGRPEMLDVLTARMGDKRVT